MNANDDIDGRRAAPIRGAGGIRCIDPGTALFDRDLGPLLERARFLAIFDAGMDMLTVLGPQIHNTQQLVRVRASRNPNEIIESEATFGERVADVVAGVGRSWTFIISVAVTGERRLKCGRATLFPANTVWLSGLGERHAPVMPCNGAKRRNRKPVAVLSGQDVPFPQEVHIRTVRFQRGNRGIDLVDTARYGW